jgi:murein DD-endopeptidase MepM/ murein hydrolase activator NlpD
MTFGATPLKSLGTEPVKAQAKTAEQTAQEKAELKKACQMFEAQFLKMLWKEMRKTVQQNKLFHGGYGEEMFTDLLDQAVSDESVKKGSMGIADMLERQFSREAYAHPGAKIGQALGSAQSGDLLNLPVAGATLTSAFGTREHPITGEEREHAGVDLAAAAGTPVTAAATGRVEFAGERGDYGNLLIITHADGSQTYYGHLEEILVEEGQLVASGQKVATVGSTGLSTGAHLHFEVRNASGTPVDPLPKLAAGGFDATT